jgi:HPt (histidine-containing phosphotransfer) domain-containing protein
MQDLINVFMPKFVASAQKRIARSLELVAKKPADVVGVSRELHAVAGEAGLLGIAQIVTLARTGEDQAKRLRAGATDADVESLLASLHELQKAVDAVANHQKGPHE